MDYWESILEEVMHKKDEGFQFKYTDIGRSILRDRSRKHRRQTQTKQKAQLAPMYFLGAAFEGVYFTKREAETLFYLLQGKTIPEVGKCLNLSARTIEFYVKNMKLKIGVNSKMALLEKIRHTDIIDQLKSIDIGDDGGT